MRIQINDDSVKIWLSANDTYNWANKEGGAWPCSFLSGKRVFCEFDSNGICDLSINGKSTDCDNNELTAITSDYLRDKLPKDHRAYAVAVGQFSTQ